MYREFGNPPFGPFTQAELTNPADELLAATTGALDAGSYEFRVIVGGSAAGNVRVERRNAADSAAVGPTVVLYFGTQSAAYPLPFRLEASERVSVYLDDAFTGTCHAAIYGEKFL